MRIPPAPPQARPLPAQIVFTRPNPDASHGTIAMVLCRYEVGGRRYSGYVRVPATRGPESADAIRARYPVGGTLQVYWEPPYVLREPSLDPPYPRSRAAATFWPFLRLLALTMFAGIVGLVLVADRPYDQDAIHGTLPPIPRDAVVQIYSLNSRQVIGYLLLFASFAVALGGIVYCAAIAGEHAA